MFLTGFFWICCIAAMAPALTEAASQAGKFTLPHFPASANVPLASAVIRPSTFIEKVRPHAVSRLQTFDADGVCISIKNGKTDAENGNNLLLCCQTPDTLLKDSSQNVTTKLSLLASHLITKKPSRFIKLQKPLAGVACNIAITHKKAVPKSKDIGRQCCLDILTMNKSGSKPNADMGLINANPSVDRDLKAARGTSECKGTKAVHRASTVHCDRRLGAAIERKTKSVKSLDDARKNLTSMDVANNPSDRLHAVILQHSSREKRAEHLLHRIQRLQVVQSERHVAQQLKSFVVHEQKKLGIPCQVQEREKMEFLRSRNRFNAKAELLKSEGVKNLSTAALVSLVRRLESSHSPSSDVFQKHAILGMDHRHISNMNDATNPLAAARLSPGEASEMRQVAGMLKANLWHVQSSLDSDATESSSGGESCDEAEGFEDNKDQTSVPILKRASWSWAVDRAAVITRWMWLQAQVSDLEYRIRQHSELFRQLRLAKGSVLFQDVSSDAAKRIHKPCLSASSGTSVLEGRHVLPPREGSPTQDCTGVRKPTSKPVNGFIGPNSITLANPNAPTLLTVVTSFGSEVSQTATIWTRANASGLAAEDGDEGCEAARSRPLCSVRKRKLVRTADLNSSGGRKVAKSSTVRCDCYCQNEPLSCALCAGHYSNLQAVDPDGMPTSQRVSLLDPSFHPVLSFPQDVPLTFHFEVRLRQEKSGRPARKSVPSIRKKSRLKASGSYASVRRTCKLARNAAQTLLSSAKFRRNLNPKQHCSRRRNMQQHGRVPGRSRKQAAVQMAIALKRHRERRRALSLASSGSSRPPSPILLPGSPEMSAGAMVCMQGGGIRSSVFGELTRRKRGESEFDINNIVIPYSIAAATRVERLQYKEILTPKWRYVGEESAAPDSKINPPSVDFEKVEDLSDEVFVHRHAKCEIEEKKRFLSYVPSLHHGRSRLRSARTDSRADSSGANTPDPISPQSMDILSQDSFGPSGLNSPVATPPPTPCPIVIHSDDSQPSIGPALRPERKRSTSFCRRAMEDFRCLEDETAATPYKPRTFPLGDEEYQEILNTSIHLNETANPVRVDSPFNLLQDEFHQDDAELLPAATSLDQQEGDDTDKPDWSLSATTTDNKQPKHVFAIRLAKR